MSEQGLQISNGLRLEWLAYPVIITILLWIWAGLVITRRQVTARQSAYYFLQFFQRFRNDSRGVIQVVVVGAVCLIIVGIFWIVFTMPASAIIDEFGGVSGFASDAQVTVTFIQWAIGGIPIISGILLLAWGFLRTIDERETGVETL